MHRERPRSAYSLACCPATLLLWARLPTPSTSMSEAEAEVVVVVEEGAEEQPVAEEAAAAAGEDGMEVAEEQVEGGAVKRAAEGEAAGAPAAKVAKPIEPVRVGYRTFTSGKEAYRYFHTLVSKLRKYQNLNEVSVWGGDGPLLLAWPPPHSRTARWGGGPWGGEGAMGAAWRAGSACGGGGGKARRRQQQADVARSPPVRLPSAPAVRAPHGA